MKNLIFKILGVDSYVHRLQDNVCSLNIELKRSNRLRDEIGRQLTDAKENASNLYNYNCELKSEVTQLTDELTKAREEIKRLNALANDYNALCAKYSKENFSLKGRISGMKRKLARYEQTAQD